MPIQQAARFGKLAFNVIFMAIHTFTDAAG